MGRWARRLAVCGSAAAFVGIGAADAGSAGPQTYIVLAKQDQADVAGSVQRAGGTLVASYPEIGVAIARSANLDFRGAVLKDARIQGVAATTGFGVRLRDGFAARAASAAAPVDDTFDALQWDMKQIRAPEAHAITPGSRSVLVGDLDTGLDWTHPDLAANVDFGNSASCVGGVADTAPDAWLDDNAHGTHTAGTIAAAANGIGITGVAPNVRIAAIKTGDMNGYFFPEAVVCAFMWAASHHMDVTNNSYFADPWYFNCRNDPEQRAIWTAERRAIRYAIQQGVTVVAAMGNFADDLAHPTQDVISPDTGPGTTREITNACAVVPAEVPGVVGVSGVGEQGIKTNYSSYGSGITSVTAPGGDFLQSSPENPTGDVLSTVPAFFGEFYEQNLPAVFDAFFEKDCTGGTCAYYAYFEGTSMATPHVAGVAALIASRYGHLPPARMTAMLQQATDPIPCPPNPFLWPDFPQFSNGQPQTCSGGIGNNAFYGHGLVDALKAVGG